MPRKSIDPSCRKSLEQLASAGELSELIDAFVHDGDCGLPFSTAEDKATYVRQGLRQCASRDLSILIEQALGLMLVFNTELLVRAETIARRKMRADDRKYGAHFFDISPEIVDEDFKRITALQDRTLALAKAVASIRHTLVLGKAPPIAQEKPRRRRSPRVIHINESSPAQTEAASG